MKPISPQDPLDDLIVAALHGDLTPIERAAFDTRLTNDRAARAAYTETKTMHDLLEKTHREAQPDPAFEQRMLSGVRRKIRQAAAHDESAWDSVLVLWGAVKAFVGRPWVGGLAYAALFLFLLSFGFTSFEHGHAKRVLGELSSENYVPAAQPRLSPLQSNGVVDGGLQKAKAEKDTLRNEPSFVVASPTSTTTTRVTKASAVPDEQKQKSPEGYGSNADSAWSGSPQHSTIRNPKAMESMKADKLAADSLPASSTLASAAAPMAPTAPVTDASTTSSPAPAADAPSSPPASTAQPGRKLIRNAQLDLEVKDYQATVDAIGALTKQDGGYVDTSNSQRGGNGKLQGTVVVKILPQNLDAFLLKLRELGDVENQSVSTDDVSKDYYDTEARLVNSQRMEVQLQELLKRNNGKVSELLQVERELERVRGEIEQMQGELKLYDFQVQYATVTLRMREKDLDVVAAYFLQERDDFSLFATDVEATFQAVRKAAEDAKAQVAAANLVHNSGSDVTANLMLSVPPDRIDQLLAAVRTLGRVANFTRQTDRVPRNGGDFGHPADGSKTEKEWVTVNVTVRSDDDSRKQVGLTLVTPAVDVALDSAKASTLAIPGAEILNSSLNKTSQGQSGGTLGIRVPGRAYPALLASLQKLGRTAALSVQRNDDSGPNSTGDDAPVIVNLSLTSDEAPIQQTEVAVRTAQVEANAAELKKQAAASGVEVKSSSFEREPSGTEVARITFNLTLGTYTSFLTKIKGVGSVESLTVHRQDQPDQARSDDATAPVEISLTLQNDQPLVAADDGLLATLRRTFGEAVAALFASVRTIGVLIAFAAPWLVLLAVLAWVGRRLYVRNRK